MRSKIWPFVNVSLKTDFNFESYFETKDVEHVFYVCPHFSAQRDVVEKTLADLHHFGSDDDIGNLQGKREWLQPEEIIIF